MAKSCSLKTGPTMYVFSCKKHFGVKCSCLKLIECGNEYLENPENVSLPSLAVDINLTNNNNHKTFRGGGKNWEQQNLKR